MASFENDVVVAKNLNFDQVAAKPHLGIINAAGKIPIGTGNSYPTPEILGGILTSPNGSITFGYSSPNITAIANPSMTVQTLTGNSGIATPVGGTINVVTANTTVKFVGAGSTLTQNFGISNLLLGSSGSSITSGGVNVSLGFSTFSAVTSGSANTIIGALSGNLISSGNSNTIVGTGSGAAITTSSGNTLVGDSCANGLSTSVGFNTAVGQGSLSALTTGRNNLALGSGAGNGYTTSESSNIVISNNGVLGESNTIRIGTQGTGTGQQNQAFIAGITGTTVAGSPVAISSTGQLSDLGFGTATQVLTSNGSGVSPTWQAPGFVVSPTYFQAYLTSNQSVAGGSTTDTIVFDTAISNVGSAYATGTGIFTAPATGYYGFSCTANFGDLTTPAGLSQVILAYTGSVQSQRLQQFGLVPATTGAAIILTASWAMPMTAGDTVQIQPFADGTGNYVIAGGALSSSAFNTSSTFSGWRIA